MTSYKFYLKDPTYHHLLPIFWLDHCFTWWSF